MAFLHRSRTPPRAICSTHPVTRCGNFHVIPEYDSKGGGAEGSGCSREMEQGTGLGNGTGRRLYLARSSGRKGFGLTGTREVGPSTCLLSALTYSIKHVHGYRRPVAQEVS